MSSGACVLASKVSGLKFLIKDNVNGSHFKNGDTNDLYKNLKKLLSDSNLRQALAKNAVKFASSFNWASQTDKIITLYKRLAPNNSYE